MLLVLMSFDLKFNKPRSSHLSLTYRTVSPKKRSLPWYLHHSFSLYCTTWNLRRAHLDTYSTYLALIPSHDHQDLWFSPSTATSSSSWLPPPLSLSLSFTNCSQKKRKPCSRDRWCLWFESFWNAYHSILMTPHFILDSWSYPTLFFFIKRHLFNLWCSFRLDM